MKLSDLDGFYSRHSHVLAVGACFFLPLKLFIAYCFLVPLILLWLVSIRFRIVSALSIGGVVIAPFVFFLLCALLSAPLSVDPLRSFDKLSGLFFFGLTILVFRDIAISFDYERLLFALVSGQCVAAIHSILEGALGPLVPRLFLGAVTESGQLAMTVLLSLGIITLHAQQKSSPPRLESQSRAAFLGLANFCAFTLLAFSPLETSSVPVFWTVLCAAAALLVITIRRQKSVRESDPEGDFRIVHILTTLVLPLLLGALLVNLKRGPWMGIMAGGLLFLFLERRKFALPVLAATVALLVSIKPIQDRVSRSEEHFFIHGGRSEIWDIGAELATRYPLGVGYRNSGFLRNFSDTIPEQLNHFHNNILNIVVETGWLGLAIFLWWIFSLLRHSLPATSNVRAQVLGRALGCAILSWQIAGLVEYNFGDSEVALIAFICTGLIAGLIQERDQTATQPISNLPNASSA